MKTRSLSILALAVSLSGCALLSRNVESITHDPAPAHPAQLSVLYEKDARLSALWIGHASVLIRIDDRLVLADPVTTNTVGAFSRRLVAPGLTAEQIPNGVSVIISHAHFDHLSIGTLRDIGPKTRHVFMPVGAAAYLPDLPIDARELPPWQTDDDAGLSITAVPVIHRAGRYGVDAMWNDATFTGYVIKYHGLTVYFGGDTAYAPEIFTDARDKMGPIDLAILPIGPIHPREFMRPMHEDGYEAVSAFLDLRAKYMLPMHYGTFINSVDAEGEDLARFKEGVARAKVNPARVTILAQGEAHVFVTKDGDTVKEDPKSKEPAPEKEPAHKKDDDFGGLGD